jgi:lysozyme
MNHRRIGPKGLALIKSSEGLRLKAYLCPAGVPTIGYGSTGSHVTMGKTITHAEADALLRKDLERFEHGVSEMAGEMTPGQFSALVSFAFNLGLGALEDSTLLKLHKAGDFVGAAAQFARWNKAAGKVLPGLVKRRAAEAALYRGIA